jgi:hypothetical protein
MGYRLIEPEMILCSLTPPSSYFVDRLRYEIRRNLMNELLPWRITICEGVIHCLIQGIATV